MNESEKAPSKVSSENNSTLSERTLKNFLWMSGGGGVEAILKIVVLIVLARLLLPEQFGFVSAALTVVALAEVTSRIGVAPALVQVKELTQEHISTGLAATLISGLVVGWIVFAAAEPIARLYQIPELKPFVQWFSVLFVIKGAGLVGEALLQRQMRFRELAIIKFTSYLFGYACVAITLSYLGFGAWSLVIGQITQAFIQTLFFVALTRESLSFGFQFKVLKSLIRFGFGVTLTQIGGYMSQNADYFVVGRWLGAEALGYYSRAYLLLQQPAQLVGNAADDVMFPALATIQDDRPRLERALNQALSLVAMVQVPLSALLIIFAPEIVLLLMGPQWGPAVLPFQILVSVLFFRTAYKLVGAILRATGKVYIAAMWQWSYAVAVIIGAFIGQNVGLWGVAVGVSCAVVFCHFFALTLTWQFIGVSSVESLKRLLRYTVIGTGSSALMIAGKVGLTALGMNSIWILIIFVALFGLFYIWLFFAFPTLFGREGQLLRTKALSVLGKLSK